MAYVQASKFVLPALLCCALFLCAGCAGGASGNSDASPDAAQTMSASDRSALEAQEAQRLYDEVYAAEPSAGAYEARDAAEGVLSAISDKDTATVRPYLEAVGFDPAVFGLTFDEFVDGFFDGFAYEVVSLRDMQDGSVEVSVNLTTRDGRQAVSALGDVYQDALNAGNTAVMATYARDVWASVGWAYFEEPYKLYMVESADGTWAVEDSASFGAALLGGLDVRQEG